MSQLERVQGSGVRQIPRLPYLLSLPTDYDGSRPYPLILFLHGAGERGSDLARIKAHGIPKKLEEGDELPFIVVSPQCPENETWFFYRESLIAILDDVCSQHAVDINRVYLTGLSMGGYGTWDLARTYPERFAAIAPICGGLHWLVEPDAVAASLKDVPVWAFHGALDTTVPITATKYVVDALRAVGADVSFTIYPELDHDSWTITYDNPELYDWFLKHRLE